MAGRYFHSLLTVRMDPNSCWQLFDDSIADGYSGYTVYAHRTPSNKWYIGITKRHPIKRWNYGDGYKGSYFYNAVQKYGWDNIEHYIVGTGYTEEEACNLERELIDEYESFDRDKGYNRTLGGNKGILGYKFTDEQKHRLSESHKGVRLSEAAKEKLRGRPAPNKGKKASLEARKKMSEAHRRRWDSGFKYSQETIEKLRIAHGGENHWAYGKRFSDEYRQKLSESHMGIRSANRKQVRCIETDEVFESALAAAKSIGLNSDAVARVCRGDSATAGGLHWEYVGDNFIENNHHARSKKVVCVETGIVYESGRAASRELGLCDEVVGSAARGTTKTAGGYHWKFAD